MILLLTGLRQIPTLRNRLPFNAHYPSRGFLKALQSCHSCLVVNYLARDRHAHNPKVVGSNPTPATNLFNGLRAPKRICTPTLAHNSGRNRVFVPRLFRIGTVFRCRLQHHLNHVAVRLPLTVCHCPAAHIHRGLNAGMAHQFALHPNRCSCPIQPRPEAMSERSPANSGCDPRCFRCWLDVLLLNFLLMVWFNGRGVGKQPPFPRLVAVLPVRQQFSHQLRCQRYEVARILRLYVAHTTVNDAAAPPELKPARQSPPTSTDATTLPEPNQRPHNSKPFGSSPRGPAQVGLHNLTQSVKLFLRHP